MPDLTWTKHKLLDIITKNKSRLRALSILFGGILLTISAALVMEAGVEARAKTEFGLVCNEIKTIISIQLHSYAKLLRVSSSLFTVSDSVSREAWKAFYNYGKLSRNLLGEQGFGFSIAIPKNKLQEHIQNIQKEGFPDYTIWPEGDRNFYTSVIYTEPFEGQNLHFFGYDMFSEPVMREAMEMARDSDMVMLSGKVVKKQGINNQLKTSILLYVPVYHKGEPNATTEERKKAILGWNYCQFDVNELLTGILDRWEPVSLKRIHLIIYDDENTSQESLLFDSQSNDKLKKNTKASLELTLPLVFNNKKWTLCFIQAKEPLAFLRSKTIYILIGGMAISILLYVLYLSLQNTKIKAREIAGRLTSDLKESENRYRTLIEWTPQAVAVHRNGELIYVNPAALKAIGATSKDDIIGKNFLDLVHPDDKKDLLEGMRRVASGGIDEHRVLRRFFRLDGKIIYVELNATLIIYDGKPSIYATMQDVTDRKHAEDELHKSKEQFSNLVATIPVGVYYLRTSANGTQSFEYVSPNMSKILDVSSDDILTVFHAAFEPIHPDDIESLVKLNDERFQNPKPFYWEGRAIVKGEIKWLSLASTPATQKNGDVLWSGIMVDITDRKLGDQLIKTKNEELIKANAEKDKFFSIIAHDLRSPFNGFLGLTQLMSEELTNLSTEDIQKIVDTMRSSATNLYRLIENLLHWASMKQGVIPFHPEIINLLHAFNESDTTVLEHAGEKSIEVSSNIPDDLEVCADTNMLQMVIRNLVSNAVKFTPRGGKITFSARISEDKSVEISIKDTGIGMSKIIVDNLFVINEQTNRKGTDGEASTGLGLLLCKEFIEKHGGKIWVESEEGKGSAFYFSLPAKCD